MATRADTARGTPARNARATENLFYSGYMIALAATVFVGFAPSFYLRGSMAPAAPLTPLRWDMIVHGILASAFMLGFPLQTWLAATRRTRLHMKVGKWLFALGALLVPFGYVVGMSAYHAVRPVPFPPGGAEAFMVLPLFAMPFTALMLWTAWRYRMEAQTHKRLMVATACFIADPAIFRLPFWVPGPETMLMIEGVMLATLLPLWLWDLVTLRRLHKGTLIGSGIFLAEVIVRTLAMPTAAWAGFVHALPGFGIP